MPIVTIESNFAAAEIASLRVSRNTFSGFISWSAVNMQPTASGPPRRVTSPQATATAAAVSRRHGSPIMFAAGTSGSARLVCGTSLAAVTTSVLSGGTRPLSLSKAWRMSGLPPKMSTNCFGRFGVERGQKRSPSPPAMITAYAFAI